MADMPDQDVPEELVERIVHEIHGHPATKYGLVWQGVSRTLAALQPGDVLGGGLSVETRDQVMWSEGNRRKAARQAAEATREACAEVARQYRPTGVSEVIAAPAQIEAAIRAMDITEITGAENDG
jgi:hypothetical protein